MVFGDVGRMEELGLGRVTELDLASIKAGTGESLFTEGLALSAKLAVPISACPGLVLSRPPGLPLPHPFQEMLGVSSPPGRTSHRRSVLGAGHQGRWE